MLPISKRGSPGPSALDQPSGRGLEDILSSSKVKAAVSVVQRVDQFLGAVARPVNQALGTHIPSSLEADSLFGWGKKNDREKLVDATSDLRKSGSDVGSLSGQLAKLDPKDPRYSQVAQALKTAEQKLQTDYGYTAKTLPKPGTLWVDPQFLGKQLENGQVKASHFPTGTPVTAPPAPLDAMFSRGRPFQLRNADGALVTLRTPAEYQAFVAQSRAASGMPRTDGAPVGVQMNFEGGGGKGKRYAPALAEMAAQGIIPTSVGGSSAGAITAALVAAGANPEDMQKVSTDPALGKLLDLDLLHLNGGAADGKAAFDYFDQKLRELTGIKDRPVTFADLKIPLQIYATKMSDTQPAPGTTDLTQAKNRLFVFSQETTPNTPVALAVRASMAIPAVFDPVQMVDPMTGREVQLVDGGVLDNLPMGYTHNGLPTVGVTLLEKGHDHPDSGKGQAKSLPGGNINAGNVLLNGYYGKTMADDAASGSDDFRNRTAPRPGDFMLSLPVWNLQNPSQGDSTFGFGYNKDVDPILDRQTRDVTRNFFRQVLDRIGTSGASGTNVTSQLPAALHFSTDVQANGKTYVATYSGGDKVSFAQKDGTARFDLTLGRHNIEANYLDGVAFGDLGAWLAQQVTAARRVAPYAVV